MDHVDWFLWLVKELISLTSWHSTVPHEQRLGNALLDRPKKQQQRTKRGNQNQRGFGLVVFYNVLRLSYGDDPVMGDPLRLRWCSKRNRFFSLMLGGVWLT